MGLGAKRRITTKDHNVLPIWTLDFESYWDRQYSLSKLSPLEYVMGDKFQLISCSVKLNDYPTDVLFGEKEIRRAFAKIDWSKAGMCAHNMSGFDAYIVAYYLGIRPRMWFCTAAMARPIHGKTTGVSLAKLVEFYADELAAMGIKPRKNNAILLSTQGKRLEDFTPAELKDMEVYNKDDTEQCRGLFKILSRHHRPAELWQIDAITRMRTEPQFELDTPMLETAASIERDRKLKSLLDLAKMLRSEVEMPDVNWHDQDAVAEVVRSELASAPKFSALLESLGVEVPTKPSPTNPEKEVPALSKTDEAFIALQEHPNDLVAAAARARLDVKSTLLETRIGKFLTAGSLAGGRLPVPIRYSGADTTGRDSGEEYNCFTGDVEVLTPHGWVRFDVWQGEPIMQWWPDGRASFEVSPGSLRKHYSGPVVDVRSTFVDATMTPEHRLVARRERGVTERPASFLLNHTGLDGIPASGLWDGHGDSLFTPAEARLMVAIAADGCVVPRKTEPDAIQVGLRRQRKIARMRELLAAVGCEYVERQYPPQVGHKGRHNTVQFTILRSRYTKGLGPWLLQLDREALTAAADEFAHWDGWFHTKTGAHGFASSVREEAEWVSLVWHLSGTPASVRCYSGGKWQVHRRAPGSATSVNRAQVTEKHHDGDVFCASVESTYIFIRRNGKIAVTGQCQNLPRINPDKPKITDCLRKSLRAPKGKVVIVADQSGIELRVNHFLWKVPSSMALYQASPDKADLYRSFAADNLYHVEPDEITKPQRQIGKLAQLGLGFGSGAKTFRVIAKTMGGVDLPLESGDPDVIDCVTVVNTWREAYAEIVQGWAACGRALFDIRAGLENAIDPWGLTHTCAEGIVLPSGRIVRYPDLRQEVKGEWDDGRPKKQWMYAQGRHKAFLTGPKVDENIVQALARDSVFDCSVDYFKSTGLRPALRVHDELVYVVDEAPAADLLAELQRIMRTPPKWWPELVVWSEGDMAGTYGDAK